MTHCLFCMIVLIQVAALAQPSFAVLLSMSSDLEPFCISSSFFDRSTIPVSLRWTSLIRVGLLIIVVSGDPSSVKNIVSGTVAEVSKYRSKSSAYSALK